MAACHAIRSLGIQAKAIGSICEKSTGGVFDLLLPAPPLCPSPCMGQKKGRVCPLLSHCDSLRATPSLRARVMC